MTDTDLEKSNFDTLAEILFQKGVKAADIKTMPGFAGEHAKEEAAAILLDSMNRMGIIKDGELVNLN